MSENNFLDKKKIKTNIIYEQLSLSQIVWTFFLFLTFLYLIVTPEILWLRLEKNFGGEEWAKVKICEKTRFLAFLYNGARIFQM